MRVSKKIDFACRVAAQLATRKDCVTCVDELAKKEGVSASYLLQILNELRQAGLVESRRGKNGGYVLADTPENISLYDVVVAIEGALLEGVESGEKNSEYGVDVSSAWNSVRSDLTKSLKLWTLDRFTIDEGSESWVI